MNNRLDRADVPSTLRVDPSISFRHLLLLPTVKQSPAAAACGLQRIHAEFPLRKNGFKHYRSRAEFL